MARRIHEFEPTTVTESTDSLTVWLTPRQAVEAIRYLAAQLDSHLCGDDSLGIRLYWPGKLKYDANEETGEPKNTLRNALETAVQCCEMPTELMDRLEQVLRDSEEQ